MSENNNEQEFGTVEQNQAETGSKAGREAAKYRTRLREVETERDAAHARVEALTTQLIEHKLPKHVPPKIFWIDNTPTEFYNDNGEINLELLNTKIAETATDYKLRSGPYVPAQTGNSNYTGDPKPSFNTSFAPKRDL